MARPLDLPLVLPVQQGLGKQQPAAYVVCGGPSGAGAAGSCDAQEMTALKDKVQRQNVLWHQFLSDPTQWWDERRDKRSPHHPDFRHKASKEPLWLAIPREPGCVDSQLVGWLRTRCEEAELTEAVEALGLLVQQPGCPASNFVFYLVIKKCVEHQDLVLARRVHALAVRAGYESDSFLANHIICMYAAHGKLEEAMQVFTRVATPDVYMWSSIILAHARHGQPAQAIELYRGMIEASVKPDNHIYVAVLKACAAAEDLVAGKQVHADIKASSVRGNHFVASSLVSMYAKCGSVEDARQVFDTLSTRNVVTWNAMIAGYSQQGLGQEALALYASMQHEGLTPADHVTYVSLLQACASVGEIEQGKQLHSDIREQGLEADAVIGSSLVNMYAKCQSLEDARKVFDSLPTKDVVTWTAMIAGYSQEGLGREALALYASMQLNGLTPANRVTFVCLLQACASVGALQQGKELHQQIREQGLETNVLVGNCLVDMYAKCGCLEDSRRVFDELPIRDVVTWNAMLNGYAEHGLGQMAMQLFEVMLEQGIQPDGTTFVSLLVACSHDGLVLEGQNYFRLMVEEHGIMPTQDHYNCMVDLLGRSGYLDEAENMLLSGPVANDVVGWTALLTACRSFSDLECGRRCFERLVALEADDASSYVLLGNIYASADRWEDVDRVESLRKSAGAKKKAAKACIEVESQVHEFRVGEDRADISSKLKSVNLRLKEGGHVPQTELVLKAVSEQDKEDSLCGHAEKLALAYGLLNTGEGTPLLVTKNLRMCNDCHSSTKIMSRLENREIIVRDAHRVHRFLRGSCSCGDRH